MRVLLAFFLLPVFYSCSLQKQVDLLVYNGTVYTLDPAFPTAEAMVVNQGKVLKTGTLATLAEKYAPKEKIDAGGKFVFPGFIDGHAHFVGYALGLQKLNLTGTKSWDEIIRQCDTFSKKLTAGQWLVGRGWDQNDWPQSSFPDNKKLNELFQDRPVYLTRVDGHAAIANDKALQLAGINPGDTISGGEYETKNGVLTGILLDNALQAVASIIPEADKDQLAQALSEAQKNCFSVGLTSLVEAGLDHEMVETIDALQKKKFLQLRMYIMLSDHKKNYNWLKTNGILKTDHLSVRSFKVYGDGALGSRGACLLQDYSDQPGWKGFLLSSTAHFDSVARVIFENGWQMCTHAIGDSSNRTLLNIYAKYLKGKNDRRWRIEHAQVVNENDFHYFGDYNIVPSVQPTHATSDMYWAGKRLGPERIKGAYAYQQLLKQNGWICLGTDFPVEDISPLKTFYAAVVRKDAQGFPPNGFQMENALSRIEALRGMTLEAARACFEEHEKGSLEKGKYADFIILDQDIMKVPEVDLLKTKVLKTFVGGQVVFAAR